MRIALIELVENSAISVRSRVSGRRKPVPKVLNIAWAAIASWRPLAPMRRIAKSRSRAGASTGWAWGSAESARGKEGCVVMLRSLANPLLQVNSNNVSREILHSSQGLRPQDTASRG